MKEVDLSNPDVVRYVVKRFGLRMNKKLGQNFLIRHAVVDDIRRYRTEREAARTDL